MDDDVARKGMTDAGDLHVVLGTGPLGQAVMRELTKRGKRVRMVNRAGERGTLPQEVEIVATDAYDAAAVHDVTKDAAVVYQCAQPKYTEWPTRFPPLQAAILEGVGHAGARLVIGENLYMYGDTDGRPIRETQPYGARTRKGATRAHMAEEALKAHEAGRVQLAIGRGSDFFGPGVLTSIVGERVFAPAVEGKSAQVIGRIDLPHTYTFIDDFGKALVILGERDEALGQAWHVPNAETVTTRRFLEMAYEAAGHPVKVQAAGLTLMSVLALFNDSMREMLELQYEFVKPYIVDSDKFEGAFAVKATPLEEAVRQTVSWYRGRRERPAK